MTSTLGIKINVRTLVLPLIALTLLGFDMEISAQKNKTVPKWYKGNLHTHSYWSDGDEFPEVILDWYKTKGYNFVALSDHNTMADGEKWITLKPDPVFQNAFDLYLKTYGSEWVNYKVDSGTTRVRLKTFEEYRGLTEEKGRFLVISSEEITDKYEDKHLHMNVTNIQRKIEPQGGNSVVDVLQNNLDQVLLQRQETGVPILPHINHPNFFYGISLNDMKALNGERFFEVYNGHHMVHNMGDSYHISTEEMWDLINISYLENGKPIMYGLATDDSHNYHTKGKEWSNAGRGWLMVQAHELSAVSLINALEEGSFYSSTGVEIDEIKVVDGKLTVSVVEEPDVTYRITFLGSRIENAVPEEFGSFNAAKASFEITKDILFVRCRIVSSKKQENPIEDMLYEMAWTQPILGNE